MITVYLHFYKIVWETQEKNRRVLFLFCPRGYRSFISIFIFSSLFIAPVSLKHAPPLFPYQGPSFFLTLLFRLTCTGGCNLFSIVLCNYFLSFPLLFFYSSSTVITTYPFSVGLSAAFGYLLCQRLGPLQPGTLAGLGRSPSPVLRTLI